MTKPTKWLCAQRRLRSTWAPAQSVQSLRCPHEENLVLSYPLSAQRWLWADWADAQAYLSLRWAHSHIVDFVMSRLICTSAQRRSSLSWNYALHVITKFDLKEITTIPFLSEKNNRFIYFFILAEVKAQRLSCYMYVWSQHCWFNLVSQGEYWQ